MTDAASVPTIGQRMASGAVWMVVARLSDRALGLASTVILARLLAPADFGLVAMATSVIAVVEVIGMFGFDVALIQNRDATPAHYNTAWTFNVLVGAAVALILVLLAVPAAHFYSEPRVTEVLIWLATATFIVGFENIGVVAFRKELRFDQEFTFLVAKRLVIFSVTIPLAFAIRNYWALVVGMVLGRVLSVVLSYIIHPYRPKFSLTERAGLFHFSKWLILNAVLDLAGTRVADFIIGRMAGTRALGLYTIANEIARLPTSDLVAPINRAIYPGYAKLSADLSSLRARYLEVSGLIATLGIPAGVGIAATAELLVPLALGQKWVDAIPMMTPLALFGVLLAMKSNNHYIYLAVGRPRIGTWLGCIHTLILLPAIILGSRHAGVYGAAVGCLIGQALFTPISLATIMHVLELRVGQQLRVFVRPLIAAAVMFVVVRWLQEQMGAVPGHLHVIAGRLVVAVASGVAVYVAVLALLWTLAGKPAAPETYITSWIGGRLALYGRRIFRRTRGVAR